MFHVSQNRCRCSLNIRICDYVFVGMGELMGRSDETRMAHITPLAWMFIRVLMSGLSPVMVLPDMVESSTFVLSMLASEIVGTC
jgi:hypothetical protein